MNRGGNLESGIQKIEENIGGATTMNKDSDDTNWKQEILGSLEFNQSKFASKLLKKGVKSLLQSIYYGYLYTRWKKLKGYDKFDPKENTGQMQSSLKEFWKRTK